MILSDEQRDRCHRTLDDVIDAYAFLQLQAGEKMPRFGEALMTRIVGMALVIAAIEGDGQAREFVFENPTGTRRLLVEAMHDRIGGGHGRDY